MYTPSIINEGYKSDAGPEQEHDDEISYFAHVVSLFQLATETVEKDHVEKEREANVPKKHKTGDQPP